MSPPPAKRMKASVEKCNNGGGLSVLEMFNRRVAKEHSKKVRTVSCHQDILNQLNT